MKVVKSLSLSFFFIETFRYILTYISTVLSKKPNILRKNPTNLNKARDLGSLIPIVV